MQTVLITGATSGIGLSIANKLHDKKFMVYGTSRFPAKHQHKVNFELLPLDVTSEKSVQSCIALFLTKSATLDILINNAGIGICGSAEETSNELAYKQLETNFWGAVKMTRAVLPLMRQQRKGKIITTGSLAGLIGVPFQSFYVASKHALEGFFKSLRYEVKSFGIEVSIVEPGFFKTNLNEAFEYAESTIKDYEETRSNALRVFSSSIENAPPPDPVAETFFKIIQSKNPKFSYRVGKDARLFPILQFMLNPVFEFGTRRKFKL